MKPTDGEFALDDFLRQLQQIHRLGSLRQIVRLIPGMEKTGLVPESDTFLKIDMKRIEGMIHAMTAHERNSPGIIDHSRRRRIAAGSGICVRDVVLLMRDFEKMRKLMEAMAGMGVRDRMRTVRNIVDFPRNADDGCDPDRPNR